MVTALCAGRSRLATFALALGLAVVTGGADGCSSDPNVEGARLYLSTGQIDNAIGALDKALAANPDNVTALALRAQTRLAQADAATDPAARQDFYDQMEADVTRASQLAPDDDDVREARLRGWAGAITKGNAALTSQGVDRAIVQRHFQTAVNLLPDSSQGHFGLGLAYLTADDAASAVPHLRRTIELDPSQAGAHLYLGRALLLSEQSGDAITVLEQASTRFPDDNDIQSMLLNAYAMSGRTDDALARYAQAIDASPDDALIRYNYGALLLRAQRLDEAVEQLERAIALDPSSSDAHYNLGAALQNKAAALTQQANDTEDNAAANRLIEERNQFLERSLPHLVRARELAAGTEGDERAACSALFQVYGQLNRMDDAAAVAECAGQSMN